MIEIREREGERERKVEGEIMTGNYQLVYYDAENVGIIGILAYPKTQIQFLNP